MLQLGDYRLYVGRSSLSVFDTLLGIQSFFRCLLVFSQTVVDLNDLVTGVPVPPRIGQPSLFCARYRLISCTYPDEVTRCPSPICRIRCPIRQAIKRAKKEK